MSQFNAEKHLEDVSKIADQLLKLLGETGRLLARKSTSPRLNAWLKGNQALY
jgi:hypothetical protein